MLRSSIRQLPSLQLKPQGNLQPTTEIDDAYETILLYRALLRQCTYLPDPAASQYIRSHVIHRFNTYIHSHDTRASHVIKIKNKKPISTALKDARKSLKYLQRANDGHPQHLYNILAMTYARVGKRKRQIMSKLTTPTPPPDTESVAQLSQQIVDEKLGKKEKEPPPLSDKFQTLLKIQLKQSASRFERATLKDSKPNVPATNSWGRKFPYKRRVNFIKRWKADTLGRILPPLEAEEWERLRKLSTGEMRWDGPVKKRKMGTMSGSFDVPKIEIDTGIRRFSAEQVPYRLTSSTERVVKRARHWDTMTNPRELTGRFMRGLWRKIFLQCPKMEWNEKMGFWEVTWGEKAKTGDLLMVPGKEVPESVFEGVNERGKVVAPKLRGMGQSR
ncbi:MAG: hypothetical protein Q9174_005641 [Haloplaca sp. 1 TL-2023]